MQRPALLRGWLIGGAALLVGIGAWALKNGFSEVEVALAGIAVGAYLAVPSAIVGLLELENRRGARFKNAVQKTAEGTEMAWDTRLNPVVEELAAAFPTLDEVEDIAVGAGIQMQRVRVSRRPDMYWHQVLLRAHDEGPRKVDAVLDLALDRSRRPGLDAVVQRYREAAATEQAP